ncbi:MAG: VOC family protein [Myxococcales bacterium]|nr:VOC family protein [Myxococcales bacterium]
MSKHQKHQHGTFSWTDLSTSDVAGAKRFYGALFNWTWNDLPMGPGMTYTMCKLGADDAAAMSELGAEQKKMGIPPHWQVYFTVENVDEATKRVATAGGKVMVGPMDVMDAGRMTVAADPTGAVFALWQANKHPGATVKGENGAICWGEVLTSDPVAAGKFYADVLGWKLDAMDTPGMHYTVFKAGTEGTAGMMQKPDMMKDVPSCWMTYFLVASCDATVAKAGELGGRVLVPPMDIPDVGRFATLMDPQGAAFSILQAPPAK